MVINYNGLKKRETYDEIIDYLEHGQEKIKYPNRKAKQLRESPYLTNLLDVDGDGVLEMEKNQENAMRRQEVDNNIRRFSQRNGQTAGIMRSHNNRRPQIIPQDYIIHTDYDSAFTSAHEEATDIINDHQNDENRRRNNFGAMATEQFDTANEGVDVENGNRLLSAMNSMASSSASALGSAANASAGAMGSAASASANALGSGLNMLGSAAGNGASIMASAANTGAYNLGVATRQGMNQAARDTVNTAVSVHNFARNQAPNVRTVVNILGNQMRVLSNQYGNRRGPLQPQQQPHEVNIWAQHGRDFPPNQRAALFNRPFEIADSQQAVAVQQLQLAARTPLNAGRRFMGRTMGRNTHRNVNPAAGNQEYQDMLRRNYADQNFRELLRRHDAQNFR